MKVYIATNFDNWREAMRVGLLLQERGCFITSRWLVRASGGPASYLTPDRAAAQDLEDIRSSQVLISLPPSTREIRDNGEGGKSNGGGRHVELGYAYALGKLCIVVGEMEHVFHCLEDVMRFDTVDEMLDWLETNGSSTAFFVVQ